MNYEEFKKVLTDALTEEGFETEERHVTKCNVSYDALSVRAVDSNVGINLNLDDFYKKYEENEDLDAIVENALDIVHKSIADVPFQSEVANLNDYSKMKDKLSIEVISAEANKDLLETLPHQNIADMAVVYRFVLSSDDDMGRTSVLVTNQMLKSMGITPEQLFADAEENAPKNNPIEIKGISQVMAELMGAERAKLMGITPADPGKEHMYVATVPNKIHGAGVLAYPGFMSEAKKVVNGSFFVLPSSIHEVLLVPDDGSMNSEKLRNMVCEVNSTTVSPEEKLTDSVYHYDATSDVFGIVAAA